VGCGLRLVRLQGYAAIMFNYICSLWALITSGGKYKHSSEMKENKNRIRFFAVDFDLISF